jgi:poly(A) polymerase
LKGAGYEALLVGGCVRDLLLGREPKDFDVVTDARPEDIKKQFSHCRVVGRRFQLAHVHFGRDYIEVATFRAGHDGAEGGLTENGRILRDNVYGNQEEDAWRRDFTINALFYNIRDFSIVDYTGGLDDLKEGFLRLIGEPEVRYREDPVRMLRAVRFAAMLGFRIHTASEEPLYRLGHLLVDISEARLSDEVIKMFLGGYAVQTFELLRKYGLFGHLFPQTEQVLAVEDENFPQMLLVRALENTDKRVAEGKPVTPGFLFAALLWGPVRQLTAQYRAAGESPAYALQTAAHEVIGRQTGRVAMPKRFSIMMKEIWQLQPRFQHRTGKRAARLHAHPRFRAAYDFLLLRAEVGEVEAELAQWWTDFQTDDAALREGMIADVEIAGEPAGVDDGAAPTATRKRRRRKRRRKPA